MLKNGQVSKEKKEELIKKVAFALVMGVLTTGLISFVLISVNVGFIDRFFQIWFKSWLYAYLLVIPAILFIAPLVEKAVHRLINRFF